MMMNDKKKPQRLKSNSDNVPKGTVYVGSTSRWENPFTVGCEAFRFSFGVPYPVPNTMFQVLEDYRYYVNVWLLLSQDWLKPLQGKDLCCECDPDHPCHADVLLEMANKYAYTRSHFTFVGLTKENSNA